MIITEWELQNHLTKKWRKNNFFHNGTEYILVCWELMFPSWDINDKRAKWNEISIDFILYSIDLKQFLCVELKNNLKGKKTIILITHKLKLLKNFEKIFSLENGQLIKI